jgi:hypothetical protein
VVAAKFACGHDAILKGDEVTPTCACGETRLVSIKARPPKFTGHARGPHATYQELPARAVSFIKGPDHG